MTSSGNSIQQADHLLIIDFEATCGPGITQSATEIIEVGAVLLSWPELEEVATFQRYVRPKTNPTLTRFCVNFTGITQQDVDASETFPDVLRMLDVTLLTGKKVLFMDWSGFDWRQLKVECERNAIENPFTLGKWDLQNLFKKTQKLRHSPSVSKALLAVNLEFIGRQHSGIDDAKNTARLVPYALPRHWFNLRREALGMNPLDPLTTGDTAMQHGPHAPNPQPQVL